MTHRIIVPGSKDEGTHLEPIPCDVWAAGQMDPYQLPTGFLCRPTCMSLLISAGEILVVIVKVYFYGLTDSWIPISISGVTWQAALPGIQ